MTTLSEMLHAYFEYVDGDLIRKVTTSPKSVKGTKAGRLNRTVNQAGTTSKQYIRVGIKGREVYAHQIVWAMHYGVWPTGHIDHIDQNTLNNRVENLREVDHTTNYRNQRKAKNNKSGFTGVYYDVGTDRWIAQASIGDRHQWLGGHKTIVDAVAARLRFNRENDFHENHGKNA